MLAREWDYYTAPGGGSPVAKELQKVKLSEWEVGRLDALLDLVADGMARPNIDFKYLRDGVSEVLIDGRDRTFRLFYADLGGGPLLLALHFISKKRQVDKRALDLAVKRLREWTKRHS
ncbi:hypothetical protein DMC64_07350 [Amycolatopsis sp. WAC 04197]|uniref:type II toxin-antitoxin system RelE/ParE family toxin n=1 Tax=Amycolatopsis sp. WAC 04197 TaxID=2203199 RepID=UPI000F786D97|nr:type II toxin-antitoxin system RelE/ParE family toxin [Amycolatopsis sp. WAC 04197]RSN47115.1 hypothetical protein DMC64_07350 [Amycolatopsis sp. WAC 04197]